MTPVTLTMTSAQRAVLSKHLFPEDGNEAVAIALCGRAESPFCRRLVVRRIELIPHGACSVRRPDEVTWPTELIVPWIHEAASKGWAIVKIHGHRGFSDFSSVDDASDRALFPSLYSWTESPAPHASVILMEDGRLFGRTVSDEGEFDSLSTVSVVGDELQIYHCAVRAQAVPEYGRRIAQSFGKGTFDQLRGLRVAVVGASGTGSPVIEQLARNCVGTLVLVDPDVVELKNLNRILNSTLEDADQARPKVGVAARSIAAMGLGTKVITYARSLFDPEVVRAVASCDVVFGCMDTVDGRHLLNKLATFYLLAYFDLGVKLEADGRGSVDQVAATVHYLQPGGSSLLSRNVYSLEEVRAAGLKRTDPASYRRELDEGYIRGIREDRPAVVQVNSLIASLGVNELLARLHPFRLDPNYEFATTRISLSHAICEHEGDGAPCPILAKHLGKGDTEPLLEWAELSVRGGSDALG